jgi:hypothetical protein
MATKSFIPIPSKKRHSSPFFSVDIQNWEIGYAATSALKPLGGKNQLEIVKCQQCREEKKTMTDP